MARIRSGEGKNSWRDPYYWCFKCFRCGRKGTRDYVPHLREDREYWREHGSYSEGLRRYIVVCRWESPCNRRYFAKRRAEAAAEATERAEAIAARIAVQNAEPVDLDAFQDQPPPAPHKAQQSPQMALW